MQDATTASPRRSPAKPPARPSSSRPTTSPRPEVAAAIARPAAPSAAPTGSSTGPVDVEPAPTARSPRSTIPIGRQRQRRTSRRGARRTSASDARPGDVRRASPGAEVDVGGDAAAVEGLQRRCWPSACRSCSRSSSALAFLLLLVTFRSIVVPIKAIVLNLLSVGAAYGVLVAGLPARLGRVAARLPLQRRRSAPGCRCSCS